MSPSSLPNTTGADWVAVARDYAAGTLTVSEICALHAVSRSVFYRWRQREGVATRRTEPKPLKRCIGRNVLAKRLLAALDQKMTEYETRLAEGVPTSAADSERDARTLNTLVRLFDKLRDFDAKAATVPAKPSPASAAHAQAANSETSSHDADRLRHDLAQRLEKLRSGLGG